MPEKFITDFSNLERAPPRHEGVIGSYTHRRREIQALSRARRHICGHEKCQKDPTGPVNVNALRRRQMFSAVQQPNDHSLALIKSGEGRIVRSLGHNPYELRFLACF